MKFENGYVKLTCDEMQSGLDIIRYLIDQDSETLVIELPPGRDGYQPKLEITLIY